MSLIKKKNLKTKKGKQKWRRNIDITELQTAYEDENTRKLQEENIRKKMKGKPNFFIDEAPKESLRPKKLDPNRFKKKIKENPSKIEKKLLKSYAKKIEKRPKIQEDEQTEVEENNMWKANSIRNSKRTKKNNVALVEVANALPHGGQSYNPSFKDHKSLLEEIENVEREKNDIKHAVSNKLNKKRNRDEPLTEKALGHQFNLLKKFKKEMDEKDKQTQEKIKEKEKNKLIEKKELKMGILKKPIRIGKNRYEPKLPDFKLSSELSSNLRTLNPEGNITRDSFDNIFRKNLVEPGNPFGAKKRRTSVPKYKYHNTEKGFTQDSEDRTLGESFNIYQY